MFSLTFQPIHLCTWRIYFNIFSQGQALLRLFWAQAQAWASSLLTSQGTGSRYDQPTPVPPTPPGLGATGDRQEIYEQLELAAIC